MDRRTRDYRRYKRPAWASLRHAQDHGNNPRIPPPAPTTEERMWPGKPLLIRSHLPSRDRKGVFPKRVFYHSHSCAHRQSCRCREPPESSTAQMHTGFLVHDNIDNEDVRSTARRDRVATEQCCI